MSPGFGTGLDPFESALRIAFAKAALEPAEVRTVMTSPCELSESAMESDTSSCAVSTGFCFVK
jgi:hypothetical protein